MASFTIKKKKKEKKGYSVKELLLQTYAANKRGAVHPEVL